MGANITGKHESDQTDEMKGLAMSYMGKPVHFLSSCLLALLSRLLCLFFSVKKRADAAFNKPVSPSARQVLVRLKNLPQSDEYFINERGRVIHVRSYLPGAADEIKAVVFFSHGYGAHCNSPRKHQMGKAMPDQGLCMFQMDLEGHGYSGGERAYTENYNHWVDDYRRLLELVAGDGMETSHRGPSKGGDEAAGIAPYFFKTSTDQRKRLREVPIFIAGESLGGALSILLGLSLYETNHPLLPRFKGEVLLAPAIKGNPPHRMLVAALRHLVVPLVPRWQIPSCLESVNRPEWCVLEADERTHANHDVLGYPGGLGWGGNMRFRTGLNLIDLTAEVSRRLEHVKFPFLIMHDPGDSIVQFNSSKELAFRASTPHGSPRGRELRPMKGWLHCLLTNCPEITIQHLQDWILYQTRLGSARLGVDAAGSELGMPRRSGVTRKSIAETAATPAPGATSDRGTAGTTASTEIGRDRSLGFDAGLSFRGRGPGRIQMGSFGGEDTDAEGFHGQQSVESTTTPPSTPPPPVRFHGINAVGEPDYLDGESSASVPTVFVAHTDADSTAGAPAESSGSLLDLFPKTAAAAAVAAAAMAAAPTLAPPPAAAAATVDDDCDAGGERVPTDRTKPAPSLL